MGGVAQLGEHLLCKQGVTGSIPVVSRGGVVQRRRLRGSGVRCGGGFRDPCGGLALGGAGGCCGVAW